MLKPSRWPWRRIAASFVLVASTSIVVEPARATAHLHVLASDQDVTIDGPSQGSRFGRSLLIGDVDGDGSDDLVVTATYAGVSRGGAYLFAGRTTWPGGLSAGNRDYTVGVVGNDPDDLFDCAALGDFDGDGRVDLAMQSSRSYGPADGRPYSGEVALFLDVAARSGQSLDTDQAEVHVYGPAGNRMPALVAGDVDGDRRTDIVFAQPLGILFGRASWPAVLDLAASPLDVSFAGNPPRAVLAGDLDGDDIDDVVLGNPTDPGVSVLLGRRSWPATYDLAASPPEATFTGTTPSLDDFDGDGTVDLALHERAVGLVIRHGGRAFTTSPPALTVLARDSSYAGAAAGDFNGDGSQDLAVVATVQGGARRRLATYGEVQVRLGPLPSIVDPERWPPDLVVHGSLGSLDAIKAGDFDGDGATDLALAYTDQGPDAAGEVLLLLRPDFQARRPAPDLFVSEADGDDLLDGRSWSTAKRTIGAALDVLDATDGPATVRVASGTYAEQVRLGAETTLLGSFVAGGGARDLASGRSTISAEGVEGRSPVVEILGSATGPSVLDGFRVTGGVESDRPGLPLTPPWPSAAGVYAASGRVLLRDCVVSGNRVRRYWLSLGPCPASPTESLCALRCGDHATAVAVAGGGSLELFNCLVHDNAFEVSADYCRSGCTVMELPCSSMSVAALRSPDRSTLRLESTTVAGNACPVGGTYVHCEGDAWIGSEGARIEDSIVASVGGPGTGLLVTGSIVATTQDPGFVGSPGTDDGYRLAPTSPAFDAGSRAASLACLPERCLEDLTTRDDDLPDAGVLDAGFHFELPPGAPSPPGEPLILRVARSAAADQVDVDLRAGARAEWQRLYVGSLAGLRAGYAHGADVGPDRVAATADDSGRCRVDGLTVSGVTVPADVDVYFLATAWNAAGESHHGTDSFGTHAADATTGSVDCP